MEQYYCILIATSNRGPENLCVFRTLKRVGESLAEVEDGNDISRVVADMGGLGETLVYKGHITVTPEIYDQIVDEIPSHFVELEEARDLLNNMRSEASLSTGERITH